MKKYICPKCNYMQSVPKLCPVCYTDTGIETMLELYEHTIDTDNSRILDAHKEQKFLSGC